MTIDIRPRYWRIVLKQEGRQFPSLKDQNFEQLPNPRILQIKKILITLLEAKCREDTLHLFQWIIFVSLCLSSMCKNDY